MSRSRACIAGSALSHSINTALTLIAVELTLRLRQPAPGVIHHSDRGVQHANHAYVARLEQSGRSLSMSVSGNPDDNAQAERFFKALKTEEVYLQEYETYAEAETNLDRFIGDVYNHKRLRSSLGCLPPAEVDVARRSLNCNILS